MAAGKRKETRTSAVIFPLGPYHPILSEPYALRLRLQSDRVVAATGPVTGYGRRDLLGLVAGQSVEDTLVVLERACAHVGQAYRLALSIAIERTTRANTPRSAQLARVFFAELEMAQSALWGLAELARALNLPALRARGLEQRERVYAAALEATGERVYWGIAQPGGVREGIQFAAARAILDWLPDVVDSWRVATAPAGGLRRAAERVDRDAPDQPPAEAAARTSTLMREDARREAPYGGYRLITLDWSPLDSGQDITSSVAARAVGLVTRLKLSADIMRVCAQSLDNAELGHAPTPLVAGHGAVTVQTAHGPARLDVTMTSAQTVGEVRLVTPCADMLAETPDWLAGRRLAHVPALMACLNLCPSCADL